MIRLTFFFSTDNFTWTESHYHKTATTIAQAQLDADNLFDARLKVLTQPAAIIATRLSDTNKPRQSQTDVPNNGSQIGSFNPTGAATYDKYADRPYSVALIDYVGVNGFTSRSYMAGIPDVAISEDPFEVGGMDPIWMPIWRQAFVQYMAVLAAAWGWRRIDVSAQVPIVGLDITTLPNGEVGIQTAAALTFPVGATPQVNVTGFRSINPRKKGLRGIYAVDTGTAGYPPVAAPFRYYLRGTTLAQAQNVTAQLGKVSPLAYVVEGYASGVPIKTTHRKRGVRALAPLGRSRGRPC